MPHKYTQTNSLTAIRDYCKKISTNLQEKTDLELIDIAQSDIFYSRIEKQVERRNIMSGKLYMEAVNTPNHCSPASEAYWSM